ncbi:MAG TPA: MmgE/PrpD family protein [Chloroflexota bacterium]|nr:MmgE/PrpD family protein [Chloroflexota bacterium]
MTELTAQLASFAATVSYDSLPPETVQSLKRIVLDCLGTSLAATTLGTGSPELLRLTESGLPGECTVFGTKVKAPAAGAALANGGLAHALNYDDFLSAAGVHLGVTSVPAAIAVAEAKGAVSGEELLAGLAAGNELMARLGFAIQHASRGYTETRPQLTQMLGYFNAAVSAAHVLGADEQQMRSALGLAFMQCAGGRQPVVEGTPAKALYAAFPSQVGVQCAQLAMEGLEAGCAAFEGDAGLFATYFGGRYDPEPLTDRLGEQYRLAEASFKPWPTTSVAHVFIEAGIGLAEQHDIHPEDVAEVRIQGQDHIRTFCEPAATRQAPRTAVEAEDSVPFAVAKAIANRHVGLGDFTPAGLAQAEALALASRLRYTTESSMGEAGVVEVVTKRDETFRARVEKPFGHPSRPLSDDQLVAKFRDCAAHASVPVDPHRVVELVFGLDQLGDVRELIAALS